MNENNSGLSASDVLALDSRGNNDIMSGGYGLIWFIALLMMGNGNFGWGGGNRGNYVTDTDLAISQNAQTQNLQNQEILAQLGNNRFDIVTALTNQNNANLINAIQGFNNLGLQITNQTNALQGQLMQLDAKMSSCCCEIKTQMLQNRYEDERAKNVTLQNALDNANQSQYILSQLGRFVAWVGSGSQAAAVAAG